MQLLSLINFTAAMQGLFLTYLLLNRGAGREHRLLALLVGVMSVGLLGAVLGLSGYYREFPHLMRIGDPLALLFGPLLYFYIHLLTQGRLPRRYGLHVLPFGLYLLSLIPFYSLSGEEKIAFGEQVFLNPHPNGLVVLILTVRTLHILAYTVGSLLLIRRFQRLLKANYSDIDQLNLDKAAFLLRLYLVIAVLAIGVYLVSLVEPLHFVLINNIIGLAISLLIYALAYSTWARPATAAAALPALVEPNPAPTPEVRQPIAQPAADLVLAVGEKGRSTHYLPDEQYTLLADRLDHLLHTEHVYLQNELSLAQLSERLGVPPYQVSELISRRYREPFFDLINRHRVEEVKRRLQDPAFGHYSILGIALDCGFNTKSSFNAAFKKFTGLTPLPIPPKLRRQTV